MSIVTPRRLRILQVIGNAIVGGMETFVIRFCDYLQRDGGFEVVCLCPYESATTGVLRALGCAIHVAPMPDEPVWRGIEYASALVADEGIDVIHAHLTNGHLLAGIVGKLTGTPVLATIHGRDVLAQDLAMHRLTDTYLHVVSRASLYQALLAGVARDRIECIVNGVDADRFRPGEADGRLHAACGLDPHVPLIGFVGRLSPEKGPHLFVRAAALALMQRPELHAVMIGDGPMRPSVLALADELGISSRLHLPGVRSDIAECLHELTIVVSTSHAEGTPLSVMEAQASGVPVVATHVGGVPEIVVIGETGLLVPPGDAEALANSITTLLDDPQMHARFSHAARERMIVHFSLASRQAKLAARLAALAHGTPTVLRPARRAALASVEAEPDHELARPGPTPAAAAAAAASPRGRA